MIPALRRATAAVLAMSLASPLAWPQSYPAKPIRIIVPLAPGGSADVGARTVGDKITLSLGQPVIIESRPGAGGAIGVGVIAKSAPDGYTIGIGPAGTMAINVHLSKMPFDPQKDLQPISGMTRSTLLMIVPASSQIQNVKDLVAASKTKTGGFSYGTPGIATAQHLAGEMLKLMSGGDLTHIPYKGASEAATAVIGGQLQFAIVGAAGIAPQVKAGKVRVIAVTGGERIPNMPDVPSVAETLPGYNATGWLSFFGPAGLPRDILARLNGDIVAALRLPDVRDRISAGAENPDPTTPEELGRFVQAESEKWGRVIKNAGIRLE